MAPLPNGRNGRAPRVSLKELAEPCARCSHQNGGHTGGAARYGWAPIDTIWSSATGWCTVPGCGCPARTNDPTAAPQRPAETATAIAPPPPIATALTGPCGHGPGPCGATPTRPFAEGPRCASCTPGAPRPCPCTRPAPWRFLAAGSRHHRDKPLIWGTCDEIHAAHPELLVVHGACYPRAVRGVRPEVSADWLVHLWCQARGVQDEPHPADWDAHGDQAGPIRNAEMVALGADECVGWPLGRSPGTWDCLRKAKAAGILTRAIHPARADSYQDSLFVVVA
ncbi:hypothetical protein Ssi03_50910 [Sphaerisporangium siamense]|uniref:YspA cpYpsA-related SLOG domain-containing protein n=1 Tax=Sphaerisporangium siamense TaxID=795645 RepID=A0A7W7GAX3_9ACTN|nr:SLOG family protein [Sphaerisporangium siamense]MBB4702205.1 hypothetical protein [Sphaerisporangium siamense]GII87101.1 hypothetical protein Ssi03_50910 [Sphaerisporangium siamense]